MGNSNQKGGDTNFIQNNIEKFIQQMLDKNLTEPYSNNYCKDIQIIVKDDLLQKLTKKQLLEKNNNYDIGIIANDNNTKKEICNELTTYYTKKIEILHTIKYLLDLVSNKINNKLDNSRCFSKNNSISRIKYGNSKYWKTIPKTIKDNIKISDLRIDMFKETNLDPSEFYYVNELDNNNDCTANGGRWIKGIDNLKKLNLIPDEKIKEYNKKYYRLLDKLDNVHVNTIQKLTQEFKKICKEDFNRSEKKDGTTKKEKVLIEIPLSKDELLKIQENIINIISTDIIQIEKIYLQIVSLEIVTNNEVENYKDMKLKLKNLESNLVSSN